MSVTFVGLKNCDTCKKARIWLDAQGIDYTYVDVRADGLSERDLKSWTVGGACIHSQWHRKYAELRTE